MNRIFCSLVMTFIFDTTMIQKYTNIDENPI